MISEIIYLDQRIPYEVIRTSRRTMAIQVTKEGNVIVRVGNFTKNSEMKAFLEVHKAWIYRYYKEQNEQRPTKFIWRDGASLLVKGKELKLTVVKDSSAGKTEVWQEGNRLIIKLIRDTSEDIAAAALYWLKESAKVALKEKTELWSLAIGVTYNRITVKNQATRWGSCSSKGNLNYNWKLIMMPEELMDYVVVHELSHRKEMNHSQRFWAEVGRALPDYESLRRRLKDYENKIIPEF